MDQVKHFIWKNSTDGRISTGRIAAQVEGDRFRLVHLAGMAPPVEVLPMVLGRMDGDIMEKGRLASQRRRDLFLVYPRVGLSGARDYLLREARNVEIYDYPINAGIHVSMYGKLNDGIPWIWLGDLWEIQAIIEYQDSELEIFEAEFWRPTAVWCSPNNSPAAIARAVLMEAE